MTGLIASRGVILKSIAPARFPVYIDAREKNCYADSPLLHLRKLNSID